MSSLKSSSEFDHESPFKNDKLDRKKVSDTLTDLLIEQKGPFVLGINATYGMGKSTFLKMWQQELSNNGWMVVCYNATEEEFFSYPEVALLAAFENEKNKLFSREELEIFDRIKQKFDLIIYDDVDTTVSEKISNHIKEKRTISQLRKDLEKLFLSVKSNNDDKPIVFVIDELDRCHPESILDLLRAINRLFKLKGINFVLSYSNIQLKSALKSIFGLVESAEDYLKSIIDVEYSMPALSLNKYAEFLYEKYDLDQFREKQNDENWKEKFIEIFWSLSDIFRLSLREQIECMQIIKIVLKNSEEKIHTAPYLVFLILLKTANSKLYKDFNNRISDSKDVLEYIAATPNGRNFVKEKSGLYIRTYLERAFLNDYEFKRLLAKYSGKLDNTSADNSEMFEVLYIFRNLNNYFGEDSGDDLHKFWTDKLVLLSPAP